LCNEFPELGAALEPNVRSILPFPILPLVIIGHVQAGPTTIVEIGCGASFECHHLGSVPNTSILKALEILYFPYSQRIRIQT
jgi:hypothetical protein